MFSLDEQEEIINEFLTACGEKQEEDFKTEYDRLNIKAGSHGRDIRKMETKTYVPIKNALLKYYDKTDVKDIDMYEYRRNKMIKNYTYVLEIHKQRNRYVCSKERLEQIDFNIYEAPDRCYRNRHC